MLHAQASIVDFVGFLEKVYYPIAQVLASWNASKVKVATQANLKGILL